MQIAKYSHAAAAFWMVITQAQGDETVPGQRTQSSSVMEEVIVTANKREQSLLDVGLAITALGGNELQQKDISSLSDLAQNVPGLTFTPSTNSTPVYTLRGIGFYETSLAAYPTVSVYLDEAPLPFPAMTTLTNFDLERVEVLKGPQGTLFGNNATGGAINYIAAKPQEEFGAGGSLSYGRFNDVRADGFVTGALAPDLKGRFAFATERSEGWQYSTSRRSTDRSRNGARQTVAARGLLDWDASENLRVQLNVNGWADNSEPMAPQYLAFREQFLGSINAPVLAARQPAPNDPRAADWNTLFPPRADNWLGQGILRMDLELGGGITATSLTSYTHYNHDQSVDGDGLDLSVVDLHVNEGEIDSFSQELRIANDSFERFRWLVGANYSDDDVYENNIINYGDSTAFDTFGEVAVGGYSSRQDMKNYAAFTNLEFDVLSTVTVKGGARYTKSERSANNCLYDPFVVYDPSVNGSTGQYAAFITGLSTALSGTTTPPIGPFQCTQLGPDFKPERDGTKQELNEDNWSYRAGIDWKPAPDFLAYVNVAKGYKAGSFPTLAGVTRAAYVPVVQESVLSYEAGVKAQLPDHRISLEGAIFHYDYEDKQLRSKLVDPVIGVLDALVNIPKSTVTGVEVSGTIRPAQWLSFGGYITYLDASIDSFTGVNAAGETENFDNTRIPYTPEWEYGLTADVVVPAGDGMNVFGGVQFNHRSETNASIGYPALFEIPSYGLLDLQVGIEASDGRWRAYVWGKNVTDEFYLTHVQQSYDAVARYTGLPAIYGLTAAFNY